MFTSTKLITLFALLGSAIAIPAAAPETQSISKRAIKPVDLHVGPYMKVESPAKSNTVGGWGGLGVGYWTFAFDGAEYKKENFVYTLYKNESYWNSSITPPPQPINKAFNCIIEAAATPPVNSTGDVTLLSREPWIEKKGDAVKSASCTIKT